MNGEVPEQRIAELERQLADARRFADLERQLAEARRAAQRRTRTGSTPPQRDFERFPAGTRLPARAFSPAPGCR